MIKNLSDLLMISLCF